MGSGKHHKSSSKLNGLGKTIIRHRFQGNRPKDGDTQLVHTADLQDGHSWTNLQSITQEGDIEEILHTAELAGNEFTAEKLNISIINPASSSAAPVLSRHQLQSVFNKHVDMLRIPRRPTWDPSTTSTELHRLEQHSFLDWRRQLAEFQERNQLLLTPYERNLQVWRQLWRVIERCELVVQIVDARNPLFFYCLDLNQYVSESGNGSKRHLLLVNKADMLTTDQRLIWAKYFHDHNIQFCFFSAELAKRILKDENDVIDSDNNNLLLQDLDDILMEQTPKNGQSPYEIVVQLDPTDILTPTHLIDLFKTMCPKSSSDSTNRMTIGLVGYPNVGKSSTINALLKSNKCSVSATPGKTKHFQTLILTDDMMLCDCPGLVFPSFATTTADMVCNGVLPIDQLRESSEPTSLVAARVPKELLERIYGIVIKLYDSSATSDLDRRIPTGAELCMAYALARGFMRQGQGNPDESRAARYILKDYVNGKLGYVHPPPNYEASNAEFNATLHSKLLSLCTKKPPPPLLPSSSIGKARSEAIDSDFFTTMGLVRVKTKGKFATQDYSRTQLGLAVGADAAGPVKVNAKSNMKKHKSGKKNHKNRIPVRDE